MSSFIFHSEVNLPAVTITIIKPMVNVVMHFIQGSPNLRSLSISSRFMVNVVMHFSFRGQTTCSGATVLLTSTQCNVKHRPPSLAREIIPVRSPSVRFVAIMSVTAVLDCEARSNGNSEELTHVLMRSVGDSVMIRRISYLQLISSTSHNCTHQT